MQRPHLDEHGLKLGRKKIPLLSGALHYYRLDPDDWRAALLALKSLNLPIVETYVPWRVHEIGPGQFDFGEEKAERNLRRFIELAAELDMLVFLRPGPHINAEMTYFGLPERIVYDRACQARSPDQIQVLQGFPPRMFPVPSYASETFLEEADRWLGAFAEVVAPYCYPEGPVVLLQIDNEGSFYFRDATYEQDYHPDAITKWQRFLDKRHGSLAETNRAHGSKHRRWKDVQPPTRFSAEREQLGRHLDWAAFKEDIINQALHRMKRTLDRAGMRGLVTVHNFPLGDQGVALSSTALESVVDLVGFDYYHARREFPVVRRRTLYLAGTHALPYSPEMGAGAPPWFTPLAPDDSVFTAMSALAHGLRGLNLYMAVDRDRWYGAPIDAHGQEREEAEAWRKLFTALVKTRFAELVRPAEIAIILPAEYRRLSRATSTLGFLSPTVLEAVTGNPTLACSEEKLGFEGPIQVLWWKMVMRIAHALDDAQVPYVYVDGDVDMAKLSRFRCLFVPSFEFAAPERWQTLRKFAAEGGHVVFGPTQPTLDASLREAEFDGLAGEKVAIDTDEDAASLVARTLDELEIQKTYTISPSALRCEGHERDGKLAVLFAINPTLEPENAAMHVPPKTTFIDCMTGERVQSDRTGLLEARIRAGHCRMFEVEEEAT